MDDHDHQPPPLWEADPGFAPQRALGVATVEIDGELLLTHPLAPGVLRFDPVTSFLWRCFAAGLTVAELAEDVADALDLPVEEALTSLTGVVTTLGRTGYLTEPAEPPILRVPSFPTIPPDT